MSIRLYRHPFVAMGSPCEIQIYSESKKNAHKTIKSVVEDIRRLQLKYSRYDNKSLLHKINTSSQHGRTIKLDAESAAIINYAHTAFEESSGLFDITSGILRRVWKTEVQVLPTPEALSEILNHVGWKKIIWDPPNLSFPPLHMELDLGGIVKEYAADRAAVICQDNSVFNGSINLGGDLRVIGPHPDGKPWVVGIKHPRKPDSIIKKIYLMRGGLATSGDYERFITIDGLKYSHIINPITGWPVRALASVSVISEFCITAGTASTIAMLLESQAPQWLEAQKINHFWVDAEGDSAGNF